MAILKDGTAPYAPPQTVLDVIERYRHRGMQSPFTKDVLIRAGVGDSLVQRITQALQLLDFIDSEGKPTPQMEALRKVPEEDFKPKLGEIVRAAYAEVFTFADPEKDDLTRIRDAFRAYLPQAQQERMVTLFLGLCEAAGMQVPRKKSGPQENAKKRPVVAIGTGASKSRIRSAPLRASSNTGGLPAPIAGLLSSLPTEGGWTKEQREKFMQTFGAVLDFCIPIEKSKSQDDEEEPS